MKLIAFFAFALLCYYELCAGLPVTQYYIAVDGATHQTKFNTLNSQGYRPISLKIHGSSSSPQYSAVWIQRSGPAWVAIHGASPSAYQTWFDKYNGQGYVSTIVSATGTAGSEVYAGVMEKINAGAWTQRCGMTGQEVSDRNNAALSNKQILKSFDEFGTPSNRRYCGIWYTSAGVDKSAVYLGIDAATYQTTFNTETTKPYWHPSLLSISEDNIYAAVFTDSSVGTTWSARHGLTSSTLATEVTSQANAGRYLITLAAGGSGTNARYAAVFAAQDIPSSRTWRTAGTVTGFTDNNAAGTKVESIAKGFMQVSGIRQVQIAIGKQGKVLLDKAYTWSEPERPSTGVNDRFLLASVSKAFAAAALQTLFDAGSVTQSTKVYPYLGYLCTTGDKRRCDITMQNLIDHKTGYSYSTLGFDPTYSMRQIAISKSGGAHPATMAEIISYTFPYNLATDPGSTYDYNNYNYLLIAAVVEKAAAKSYFAYLNQKIITPEGLNVGVWQTSPSAHASDHVVQESMFTGPSALQPLLNTNVAAVYGGDGMYKEAAVGPAALAASASTLVKFISKHAVWGNGGRAPNSARSGSTPGTSTYMESRGDGIDWAIVVNTRDFPHGDADFTAVWAQVDGWLNGITVP